MRPTFFWWPLQTIVKEFFSLSFPDVEDLEPHDKVNILIDFPSVVKVTASFFSDALRKRTKSLQTDVSRHHLYAMLYSRSSGGMVVVATCACANWLSAPAVVLATTEGATVDCGLAVVAASPSQWLTWEIAQSWAIVDLLKSSFNNTVCKAV